jgi:hypothetical protein
VGSGVLNIKGSISFKRMNTSHVESAMNLTEVFVLLDDSNKDQHFFDTTYIFTDENGKKYMYSIQYHMGMHVEDFKDFFKSCAKRMKVEGPYECEFDKETVN